MPCKLPDVSAAFFWLKTIIEKIEYDFANFAF